MSKLERFKAALLPKRTLQTMLDERVHGARSALDGATRHLATVAPDNEQGAELTTQIQTLSGRVDAQEAAGNNNPGDAWVAMKKVCEDADEAKTQARVIRYQPLLTERVAAARAMLKAASLQISGIAAGNPDRQPLEATVQSLSDQVTDQEQAGLANPYDAWLAMDGLGKRVADGMAKVKTSAADSAKNVNMWVTATTMKIAQARHDADSRQARGELSAESASAYRQAIATVETHLALAVQGGATRDALDACKGELDLLDRTYRSPAGGANRVLNERTEAVRGVLVEARKARRSVSDEVLAVEIATEIQQIEQALDGIIASAGSPRERMDEITSERLQERADAVLKRAAKAGRRSGAKTDAGTASKATVQALLAIPALARHLNTATPDPQGRTPLDHVKAVLATFDDQFAAGSTDDDRDTELNRQGTAVRVATVVGTAARGIARGLHDPALQPLIAKSLLQEYESEMTSALRRKKLIKGEDAGRGEERAEVKNAITLAQAIVMDDPMTKLLTGKITFPDAVQRVRDMTAFANESRLADEGNAPALLLPSEMLKLLRQQFESTMGSYSADELSPGKPKAGAQFPLENLLGELNPEKILGTDASPDSGLIRQQRHARENSDRQRAPIQAIDGPAWADTGLAFNDETLTLLANLQQAVSAWDTPEPQPADNAGQAQALPLDDLPDVLRRVGPKIDKGILVEAAKTLHKPDDPAFLAGKKMYANPEADADEREALAAKDVPRHIPAPGLGQDHAPDGPLADASTKKRRLFIDQYRLLAAKLKALGTPLDDDVEAITQQTLLANDMKALGGELKKLDDQDKAARQGAINQRQYEHLRLLARADADEQTAFEAAQGMSIKEWVLREISSRYGVDAGGAEDLLDAVAEWMKTVPLTITFNASNLFSNPDKDEPTYGSAYTSEVVHSRGQKDLKDLIGRDDHTGPDDGHGAKVSVTGGRDKDSVKEKIAQAVTACEANAGQITVVSTSNDYSAGFLPGLTTLNKAIEACLDYAPTWQPIFSPLCAIQPATLGDGKPVNDHVQAVMEQVVKLKAVLKTDATWVQERGREYMRWRTDKDDREARLDHLVPEDQQIFGAANPNFEEMKGGAEGKQSVGENFYGDCHFLLSDSVRSRSAFVMRGSGAVNPTQRMAILMLVYDMLKGGGATKKYLDTVLLHAKKKDVVMITGLDWEVHLYGGFDITKDAKAIYLPSNLDTGLRDRISRFAQAHGVHFESYDKIPVALSVLSSANPTSFELGA